MLLSCDQEDPKIIFIHAVEEIFSLSYNRDQLSWILDKRGPVAFTQSVGTMCWKYIHVTTLS